MISIILVIYALLVWSYALIFIKPRRIRELIPVAVLAFIILFIAEEYLITLDLYKFNKPWLPVFGIPLFHLLWGAGSGIVVMNYMKKEFAKKIVMILFFTIITLVFEFIAEAIKASTHLGNFSEIHDVFEDFVTLILLVFVAEGLWGDRIYKPNNQKS